MANPNYGDVPEDMDAWLDSELQKIKMDKSDIIRELGDAGKLDFEDFNLEQLLPTSSPTEVKESEAYSQFLSSFANLNTESNKDVSTDGISKDDDVKKDSPVYLMYKDQLQLALARQNLSMDDYLKANITIPNEEPIIEEDDTNNPSFFSEVNIDDYNLKLDEIEEVKEVAEHKFNSMVSVPQCLGVEMSKLESLTENLNPKARSSFEQLIHEIHVDAEAIRQIPKWQKDLEKRMQEANDQRKALEIQEKKRRERVRTEIDDLESQVKLRVAELTASIEAEKKNLDNLKKMAGEANTEKEEHAALTIQSNYRRHLPEGAESSESVDL